MKGVLALGLCLAILAGCGPAVPSRGEPVASAPAPSAPARAKVLTIGVPTQLQSMGVFAGQSTGGWTTLTELHSAGLISSDYTTPRPIGRRAEKVPSLDDGSIAVQPDGR